MTPASYRVEHDSMGALGVPHDGPMNRESIGAAPQPILVMAFNPMIGYDVIGRETGSGSSG